MAHPLAPTPTAGAEPTLRSAYLPPSVNAPGVNIRPTSPPPPAAPREPEIHVPSAAFVDAPFVSRRVQRRERPRRRVIAAPGAIDPLSGALTGEPFASSAAPAREASSTAGVAAYATSLDSILHQRESSDAHPSELAPSVRAAAAPEPELGPVRDVRLAPASVAGVFTIELWRDEAPPATDTRSIGSGSAGPTHHRVTRSIADFVWLEARLHAQYDGVIVPHLPPMGLRGRLMYGFVYEAERLRGLQRFVALLCAHPALAHVDETVAFLGDRGAETWLATRRLPLHQKRNVVLAGAGAGGGTGDAGNVDLQRLGAFRLWQAGRRVDRGVGWFLNREEQTVHQSAEDRALERLQRYVRDLRMALGKLRAASKAESVARSACIDRTAALQAAFRTLGAGENGVFGELMQAMHIGDSALDTTRAQADRLLQDVLFDYETRVASAQRLVERRCGEREAYAYAVESYAALRARLEALTSSVWDAGAEQSQPSDLRHLHAQLENAKDMLSNAQRQYRLVDRSTNDELRRLRVNMQSAVLHALKSVAANRAIHHAAVSECWSNVARSIDRLQEDDALRADIFASSNARTTPNDARTITQS